MKTGDAATQKIFKLAIKKMLKSGDPTMIRVAKAARRRSCGECQLCCELMSVPDTTGPNELCQHQCEAGCAVYTARPSECKTFLCCWRMGAGPESARPDRSGALVDPDSDPTRHSLGLSALRFKGPFDEEALFDLITDLRDAWGAQHIALTSEATNTNEDVPYFDVRSRDLYKKLAEAAATGETPWNED